MSTNDSSGLLGTTLESQLRGLPASLPIPPTLAGDLLEAHQALFSLIQRVESLTLAAASLCPAVGELSQFQTQEALTTFQTARKMRDLMKRSENLTYRIAREWRSFMVSSLRYSPPSAVNLKQRARSESLAERSEHRRMLHQADVNAKLALARRNAIRHE